MCLSGVRLVLSGACLHVNCLGLHCDAARSCSSGPCPGPDIGPVALSLIMPWSPCTDLRGVPSLQGPVGVPPFPSEGLVLREEIATHMQNNFAENDTPEVSVSTVWDAFKGVTHGFCISEVAYLLKLRKLLRDDLECDLKIMEGEYAIS